MKRIIAAAAFAVLAVPAFAFAADTSAPFEKSQFDRTLPNDAIDLLLCFPVCFRVAAELIKRE